MIAELFNALFWLAILIGVLCFLIYDHSQRLQRDGHGLPFVGDILDTLLSALEELIGHKSDENKKAMSKDQNVHSKHSSTTTAKERDSPENKEHKGSSGKLKVPDGKQKSASKQQVPHRTKHKKGHKSKNSVSHDTISSEENIHGKPQPGKKKKLVELPNPFQKKSDLNRKEPVSGGSEINSSENSDENKLKAGLPKGRKKRRSSHLSSKSSDSGGKSSESLLGKKKKPSGKRSKGKKKGPNRSSQKTETMSEEEPTPVKNSIDQHEDKALVPAPAPSLDRIKSLSKIFKKKPKSSNNQ